MSLLNTLSHLFDHHQAQATPLTRQVQFGATGAPQNVPAQMQGRVSEDSSLVNGAQLPHPLNMDVGQLYGSPQAQGNQFNPGYSPLQATTSFGAQQPPQTYWQNLDGVRRNMVNPQVQDNGYIYGQY